MLPFAYEDRFPDFNSDSAYAVTNEEPKVIHDLIGPFDNGLGIASAGEVTFLSLLPKVRASLTLVDHSYSSLRAFLTKALLLMELGPAELRALMIHDDPKVPQAAFRKVEDLLPERLRLRSGTYDVLSTSAPLLRVEWFYADISTLEKAAANLHKVRLIHGDLLDAAPNGPFDFAYLSNALEHSGRQTTPYSSGPKYVAGKSPDVKAMTRMFTPGASVVWCSATPPSGGLHGNNHLALKEWPVQRSQRNFRNMTWYYNLSEVPPAPPNQVVKR